MCACFLGLSVVLVAFTRKFAVPAIPRGESVRHGRGFGCGALVTPGDSLLLYKNPGVCVSRVWYTSGG